MLPVRDEATGASGSSVFPIVILLSHKSIKGLVEHDLMRGTAMRPFQRSNCSTSTAWRGSQLHSEMPMEGDVAPFLHCLRVMVVEDTWVVASAVRAILEENGLVVLGPAATIAAADHLLSEQTPDLALVDIKLKGELAFGMIDPLHKAGTAVVVMTGYSVLDPIAEASAILEKPFCEAELLTTLADVRRSRLTC
jgi:CheY-like chemotaxis protein